MPVGKYTAADLAPQAPTGKYTAADLAPPAPPPASQGFLGSFADSSGLSTLGHALIHPVDAVSSIPAALSGIVHNTTDNIQQGIADYQKSGLSETTRRDFGRAVPILGPTLATAQAQHDAGNNAGMAGTLAGTVGAMVAPKIAGGLLSSVGKAAVLAATSPDALKLAATRVLAPGDAGAILNKALRPGIASGPDTAELFSRQMGNVLTAKPNLAGISDFVDATGDARAAKAGQYQDLIAPYKTPAVGPFRPSSIDGSPIAVSQVESIPKIDLLEKPPDADGRGGIQNAVTKIAGNYDKGFTVPELDDVRQGANQKLHAFYAKAGGDQYGALANPETARMKAVGDTSRSLLYDKLAADAGVPVEDVQKLQQDYGDLSEIQKIAGKRETVFARHDPVSLAEKVAVGHSGPLTAVTNFAVQRAIKGLTDPDALIRSAVDRYSNPAATPLVPGTGFLRPPLAATGAALNSAGQGLADSPAASLAALLLARQQGRFGTPQ